MSAQQTEFQDRLARILAGQGTTKATVFVGQDLSFCFVPANRRGGRGMRFLASNAGYALSYPLCFAAGVLAHGFERYAEWVFRGVPKAPANVDVQMVQIALTGVCIAVVATHLAGLRDRALLLPKLLGVAFGMLFFHNFVHHFPHLFDALFSPIWTAKVISMTEANSLLFRGVSFRF